MFFNARKGHAPCYLFPHQVARTCPCIAKLQLDTALFHLETVNKENSYVLSFSFSGHTHSPSILSHPGGRNGFDKLPLSACQPLNMIYSYILTLKPLTLSSEFSCNVGTLPSLFLGSLVFPSLDSKPVSVVLTVHRHFLAGNKRKKPDEPSNLRL